MEEKKFLILVTSICAASLCILILCITGYNMYTARLVARAVDPIATACALSSDYRLNSACVTLMQRATP